MKERKNSVTGGSGGGSRHSPSTGLGRGQGKAIDKERWVDQLSAFTYILLLLKVHSILIKGNIIFQIRKQVNAVGQVVHAHQFLSGQASSSHSRAAKPSTDVKLLPRVKSKGGF